MTSVISGSKMGRRSVSAGCKPSQSSSGARIEMLEARRLLSLAAPVMYNIGTAPDQFVPNATPSDVVSADFTGDGKADLIVAHTADNCVYFLKGNGDGTFQPAVKIPVGQAIQGDVLVGDFNNDGKLDLLLITANLDQPIVMLGNGDGTFKPAITSSSFAYSGYYPRGWTVGDFTGDGKLDIACTLPSETTNTGRYEVLLGNGDGTFKSAIVGPAILGYSRNITTGDFNHDGKLDLAIADGQGTSGNTANVEMTILLGNGDGTFTLGGHYASPQFPDGTNLTAVSNPEDVVTADLTGDGNLDVIESDYDNTINVFLGNGDGTFQPAKSYDPGNYPRDVIPVDLNHDGKIDLVVTNVGINAGGALQSTDGDEPGSVAVLLSNGDGTFQAPITYSPSAYPGWTAVGDFNGDGYPDLATTEVLNGHAVNVMMNLPSSTNQPPDYVNPPSASPLTVTSNTTMLSALASDAGGESDLTYTWATVGSVPAPVTFSINGTNAAKNTIATFTKAGTYLFQAAATDALGLSIIDLVTVTVNQTLTKITVTPGTATAAINGAQQFAAAAYDQFGNAITPSTFTWSITGPGNSIDTKGNATFGTTPGSYTVAARISAVQGSAGVTVQNFAVSSGSTLNINLSALGAVSLAASGASITASQNGVQMTFAGITSVVVTDTASNDVLNFSGPVGIPFSFVNCGSSIVIVNGGTFVFAAANGGSVNLGTLSVAAGAKAQITPATTQIPTILNLTGLSIAVTGLLDVTNNKVLINYGSGTDPISSISSLIARGYAKGAWNGTGIVSTTAQTNSKYALGYADSADAGNPASLASGQIEIKYTLLGDANLDGEVNGADFAILATNFSHPVSSWDQGDFNYDGTVNGTDFGDLAANFDQSSQIAATASLPTSVTATSTSATLTNPAIATIKHVTKKKRPFRFN
jgi:hypothetical protein